MPIINKLILLGSKKLVQRLNIKIEAPNSKNIKDRNNKNN